MKEAFLLIGLLAGGAALVAGFLAQVPPPAGARMLIEERYRCLSCHSLDGFGGMNGPPLDHVGGKYRGLLGSRARALAWFVAHIEDPRGNPGSGNERWSTVEMPVYDFRPGDVQTIAEFLADQL